MRRTSTSRSILAVVAVTAAVIATACQTDAADQKPAAVAIADSGRTHVDSAAGDVTADSSAEPVAGRWITDANALALLATMNAKQIAAADAELQSWHSDSVRAFAVSVAREHAELQHSVDSIADRLHLAPIAPALNDQIAAAMQAPIDSLKMLKGSALDRAFITQQVASQAYVANYVDQLSGVAQHPEMQALLASAATRIGTQLAHARALQASVVAADSVQRAAAADSAATRAARRKR